MTVADSTANRSVHANGKLNGQATSKRRTVKQRGFFGWAFSLFARIATWAAILTILFRCPTSPEACDEASPFICKPYFHVKNAAKPHVQPYFDQYAAPYVDLAKPYYDTLNSRVLTPTRRYVVLYGTPWANKGYGIARAQWEMNGQPQLVRLQTLTKGHYEKSIAPHLAKAEEAVGPYYNALRKHSLQAYNGYVLPAYEFARPYLLRGYNAAAEFTTTKALPATSWAWGKANAFLDTAVWPQLRVVYVENVEPQLVRIGERLARYKAKSNTTNKASSDEAPVKPASSIASISSSFSKPPPQSPSTSATTTNTEEPEATAADSDKTESPQYWNPVEAPAATENESELRRTAREMVASDLATWQNKFASQAEEGASAIEDQVEQIAHSLMDENARVTGKGLLRQLEDTIAFEIANVKQNISKIIESGIADAHQEAISAVRSAGVAIKKKAQLIRGWREDYDTELQEAVLSAADVHFQILDETRNLALTNIGMKWAWTDGVTYKDWQKYHELKGALNDWTEELKQLIVTHPALLEAQELSHQIEDDGMTMASAAAKELVRLKEVSNWKILAHDFTDNFDSEEMRLAAEHAAAIAAAATKEETEIQEATEQSQAERAPNDDTLRENVDEPNDHEPAQASVEGLTADAETPTLEPREEPIALPAEDAAITIAAADNQEPLAESEESSILSSEAAADTHTTSTEAPDFVADEEDGETATPAVEDQHTPVSPAMFGAAAQSVADRHPILDDDTDSNAFASVTSAAQAAYSSAVALAADRYSSAFSVVSAQVEGTSRPVHEQLFSSVSAVYDGAVSAASKKFNDAVAAASSGVYNTAPTPTKSNNLPDWKKVESIAAQRLSEGKLWAEIQYQSILIALQLATPTPTSPSEKYYEQAKYHYYAGLGMAQDRYSSFMAAASSAWSSVTATATATPTPTDFVGSASSMASVAGKSARSAVGAADDAVKSAYTAASQGVMSAAQDAEDAIHQVADAAAEQVVNVAGAVADTWDVVVSELSIEVYGQPTAIGWYEGATKTAGSAVTAATEAVAAAAAQRYYAINKMVSELVIGKEPTFSESVMSRLSAIYSTATSNVGSVASEASAAASSAGDKVGSAASRATEAVKGSAQQVRDEL
ncbi:transcription factor hoxa13 [Metarhizium robertsii ARSEF 23]|uniref:Transcription factor hoxa13 n=1 Tax=Metarhizium robertsii (strain ARSEF 23 / ATCC MYA-3075) TaxID=655844 RepID=E9F1E2_METRA|nr:transcription factor hoxa13 [Metarhizium robertsii ARSEF 23]EFY98952.2 transcription factor hoxa13 [Metarhizium robertsii ARSEF 23]